MQGGRFYESDFDEIIFVNKMRKLMMAKETIANQYEQLTVSHEQLFASSA
ncbi:hypothetical protein [Bacillus sp. REN10]|nr:hypothetical protein [Bacillus sp. REN10]